MLVKGSSGESARIGDLHIAPGLGLIRNVIIDQHFAERGRMGRLLAAVAQNPSALGVGIDEDTAIVVEGAPDRVRFHVIGAGAVYVADGRGITYTNIADGATDRTLSLLDVRLHVLAHDDGYDVVARRPVIDRHVVALAGESPR
jgi:cyanophycinase